jgi:valyl-tRNA synthetase
MRAPTPKSACTWWLRSPCTGQKNSSGPIANAPTVRVRESEAKSLAGRLDNVSFMERAPREVVQEARGRHAELIAEIEKLRVTLGSLGKA